MAFTENYIGSFVPTTQIWDIIQDLSDPDLAEEEQQELELRLYQYIGNIAISSNTKDIGYYSTETINCGQLFFPNPNDMASGATPTTTTSPAQYRSVNRKVVNFGALPDTATKSVAHDILFLPNYSATRIYGAASLPVAAPVGLKYLPLPFADVVGTIGNIQLDIDNANVNITTASNLTAYTITYVIIEYLMF